MVETSFKLPSITAGSTLTGRVYSSIKQAILSLELKPGSPLVEDELARQLGTSKTPVRDALITLERDGLVIKIPYKGTYVTEVALQDATDIFEIRSVLEGLAARRAVRAFSPRELDDLAGVLAEAAAARVRGDFELASQNGARFHKAIHARADNQRILPILEKLDEQLERLRRLSDRVEGRLEKSGREHQEILEALKLGDPEKAEQAMRAHLESVLRDFSLSGYQMNMTQASPIKE
jgi:DNA-binding GntR family transcriptional regulator